MSHRRAQDYRFAARCIRTLRMHRATIIGRNFKPVDIGSKRAVREGPRAAGIAKELELYPKRTGPPRGEGLPDTATARSGAGGIHPRAPGSRRVPAAPRTEARALVTGRHLMAVSYTHLRAHETRHDLVC